MYYSYAEKKGSIFSGWTVREVAFDCSRRYLYYSDSVKDTQIVPCTGPPIIETEGGMISPSQNTNPSLGNNPVSPTAASWQLPLRSMEFPTPAPPHDPRSVVWKCKMKVDGISCMAHTHEYKVYDPHLKEIDFYQMEIYGEKKVLSKEEIPPPEPLLCPSTSLAGAPGRCVLDNEEFIRDPFFQRELYDGLKTLFTNIRIEQETAAMREGRERPSTHLRTIPSPGREKEIGTPKDNAPIGDRVTIILRFRTEYEFRRFLYVIKTVLGYDKLTVRPYRGFPPYDPRNGIILAHLPLYKWHSFKRLQKAPIYSFVRGDLYGRSADNKRTIVLLKGGFLCVTHDTAIVLRDEGGAYCEVRLQYVEHFRYNYVCSQPYLAFMSDVGHTDIFFVPQPPLFGHDSISRFNAREEVIRVHRIVYETCFCSMDIRRVIEIKEVLAPTVRRFIDDYVLEFERIRVDLLDPTAPYSVADDNLPAVWEQAQQSTRRIRQRLRHSEPAIPLYENHTNKALTQEQLETLQMRLSASPNQDSEIIGISLSEANQERTFVTSADSVSEGSSSSHFDPNDVPSYFQESAEYLPSHTNPGKSEHAETET